MTDEHREALDAVADKIIETFGSDDPKERTKLVSAIEVGQLVAEFLQSEVADEGSWVDTGSGGDGYDCHVRFRGREFGVHISPGTTEEEDAEQEREWKEEAGQWDLLCPRVIAALRTADPALADEFEAYVTPPAMINESLKDGI